MIGVFNVTIPVAGNIQVMVDGRDLRELESRAFAIMVGRKYKITQKDLRKAIKKWIYPEYRI